jgi:hypothetical protein
MSSLNKKRADFLILFLDAFSQSLDA